MNKTFKDYSINIVWISTAASDVLAGINSFHSVLQEITSLFGTGTASGTPQQNTKGSWWRVTRLQACRHGLSLNWDSPACTEARACFLTVSGSSLSASSSNLTQTLHLLEHLMKQSFMAVATQRPVLPKLFPPHCKHSNCLYRCSHP